MISLTTHTTMILLTISKLISFQSVESSNLRYFAKTATKARHYFLDRIDETI